MATTPTFGNVRIETLDNTGFKVKTALNNFPYYSYSFGFLISTVNKDPKFAVNDNVHTPTPEVNTTKYKISYQDSGLETAAPFEGGFYSIGSTTIRNGFPTNFDLGIDLLGLLDKNKTYYIKPYATLLWVDTYYGETQAICIPGEFELKSEVVNVGINDVTLQASLISSNGDGVGERGWLFAHQNIARPLKSLTYAELLTETRTIDPKVGAGISIIKELGLPNSSPIVARYYAVNTSYVPYQVQFAKDIEFNTKPYETIPDVSLWKIGVSENKEAINFRVWSVIYNHGGNTAEVYIKLYNGTETVPNDIPLDAIFLGKQLPYDGGGKTFEYWLSTLGLTTGSYIIAAWVKNSTGVGKKQLRFNIGGEDISPYMFAPMVSLDAFKINDFVGLYAKIVNAGSYLQSYRLELLTPQEELVSLFTFDGLNENGWLEFNKNLENLPASTSYIFRLTLKTDYTEEQGNGDFVVQDTFTTNDIAASATISLTEITEITKSSTKVSAEIITAGGYEITSTGIIYSTSAINSLEDGTAIEGFLGKNFDVTIEGLTENTLYYVRPYVGNIFGNQGTFTTLAALVPSATIVLNPATLVTQNSAKLKALITIKDGFVLEEAGIIYSTIPITQKSDGKQIKWVSGSTIEADIANLSSNTTYHVRGYIGNVLGDEVIFTTTAITKSANITLLSITDIKKTSAFAMAEIKTYGGYVVGSAGIIVHTESIVHIAIGTKYEWTSGNPFAPTFIDLLPNTKYYVRPYLDGVLGNEKDFTTLADENPSVSVKLDPISGITKTTANATAVIKPLGGYAVTSGEIRYSTSPINAKTDGLSGGTWSAGDTITANITGLTANTLYYVRPFVNDVLGIQESFTTIANDSPTPTITLTKTKVQDNKYSMVINPTVTPTSKGVIFSKTTDLAVGKGTMVSFTSNTQEVVFPEAAKFYIKAWMVFNGVTYYSPQTDITVSTVIGPDGFPLNPYLNMEWTIGTQTWIFNGVGWAKKKAASAPELEEIPVADIPVSAAKVFGSEATEVVEFAKKDQYGNSITETYMANNALVNTVDLHSITTAPDLPDEGGLMDYSGWLYYNATDKLIYPAIMYMPGFFMWLENGVDAQEPKTSIIYNFEGMSYIWNGTGMERISINPVFNALLNVNERSYADNIEALAGGLVAGEYYHTSGVVKVVI